MSEIPAITGSQMAEIDAFMMHELGVNTYQLMELAGYGVADAIRRHPDMHHPRRLVVLAGSGGNGGDAMVAARLLTAWGHTCSVVLNKPKRELQGIVAHQMAAIDALGIPVIEQPEGAFADADLIIDGLLGFSLHGDPHGETARLIRLANAAGVPIVSIDVPSGLDANSGRVGEPCIRADQTVTLALPKTGLVQAPPEITGGITLADIGVPPHAYDRFGCRVSPLLFAHTNLVPVREPASRILER